MSTNSLVDSSTYVPSHVVIPDLESIYDAPETTEVRSAVRFPEKKVDPGSVEWTARQLRSSKPEVAIGVLDVWANRRRRAEVVRHTGQYYAGKCKVDQGCAQREGKCLYC